MPGADKIPGIGPFVHLRVASADSLQYGASQPADLVASAAGMGMDALGLTDRDGLYGAVDFARACRDAGISPVIGVDLAMGEGPSAAGPVRRPAPAKGGP
ncbi:MAG: PHP domain-containing protein, partial [Propionibacterium sp.]